MAVRRRVRARHRGRGDTLREVHGGLAPVTHRDQKLRAISLLYGVLRKTSRKPE